MIDADEICLVMGRLATEEGLKLYLYDDKTDLPVKAPKGNATIGYGCNVQAGWTAKFAWAVLRLQVIEVQEKLLLMSWYLACNAVRRSVLLDIGFNDGYGGLLEFVHMLKAIVAQDWVTAAHECQVKNPELKGRYEALAKLLLTGVIGA